MVRNSLVTVIRKRYWQVRRLRIYRIVAKVGSDVRNLLTGALGQELRAIILLQQSLGSLCFIAGVPEGTDEVLAISFRKQFNTWVLAQMGCAGVFCRFRCAMRVGAGGKSQGADAGRSGKWRGGAVVEKESVGLTRTGFHGGSVDMDIHRRRGYGAGGFPGERGQDTVGDRSIQNIGKVGGGANGRT